MNELAFMRVLKLITFMVGQIITFMFKILFHSWLVSNLLHLWLIFITLMVDIPSIWLVLVQVIA